EPPSARPAGSGRAQTFPAGYSETNRGITKDRTGPAPAQPPLYSSMSPKQGIPRTKSTDSSPLAAAQPLITPSWLAGPTDARENLKKLRRQLGLGNNKSPACAEPVGPSTTVDFYRHQGDRSREVDPCSQGRMLLDLLVGMHCSRWVVPGSVRI